MINRQNQARWIEMAEGMTKAKLEKEVARVSPRDAVREKLKYVSASRLELQVGVSEALMLKIRRAQDLVSQKRREPASLESVLDMVLSQFLEKEDPVRKAERQKAKGKLPDPRIPGARVPGAQAGHEAVGRVGPGLVKSAAGVPRVRSPRVPLPKSIRHRLILKFRGRCGFEDTFGKRCDERRFLEVHHLKPVSQGGTNELENLKLLCSGHHKVHHI